MLKGKKRDDNKNFVGNLSSSIYSCLLISSDPKLMCKSFVWFRLFRQYLVLVLVNQMASGLFRFIAAMGRNMIVANTFGSFALLILFALGGFVLSRGMISLRHRT